MLHAKALGLRVMMQMQKEVGILSLQPVRETLAAYLEGN